jgi:iron complex transport system ATP-binding protein
VVLGPNGAGKTTVLQLAAALLHPTRGEVDVLGETLGAVDVFELRPRIGMASAALAATLPPGEKVHDVVITAGYAVTGRWREAYDTDDAVRADALLGVMGVDGLRERTFGTLSEGERKRVQIARALMPDPELLLLDEPAAGPTSAAGRTRETLGAVARNPLAPVLVLVTHHVEEIPLGFTHACCCARVRWWPRGDRRRPHRAGAVGGLRPASGRGLPRRALDRTRRDTWRCPPAALSART